MAVKIRKPTRLGSRKKTAASPSRSRFGLHWKIDERLVRVVFAIETSPAQTRRNSRLGLLLQNLLVLLKKLVELGLHVRDGVPDALLAEEHRAEVTPQRHRRLLPGSRRLEGSRLGDLVGQYVLDDTIVRRWGARIFEGGYRRLAGRVAAPGLRRLLEGLGAGYHLERLPGRIRAAGGVGYAEARSGGPRDAASRAGRHRRDAPLEVGVLPYVYELPGPVDVHADLPAVEGLDPEVRVREVGDGGGDLVLREHADHELYGLDGLRRVERALRLRSVHVVPATRPQPGDHEIEHRLHDVSVLLGARVRQLRSALAKLLPADRLVRRRSRDARLVEEVLVIGDQDRAYVVAESVDLLTDGEPLPYGLEEVVDVDAGVVVYEGLQGLQSPADSETRHAQALHGDDVRLVLTGELRGQLVPVVLEGDGLQLYRDVRVLLVYVFGELLPHRGLLRRGRPHRPAQVTGSFATTSPTGPSAQQTNPGKPETSQPQKVPTIHRPSGECPRERPYCPDAHPLFAAHPSPFARTQPGSRAGRTRERTPQG